MKPIHLLATVQSFNANTEIHDGMGNAMMLDDGW